MFFRFFLETNYNVGHHFYVYIIENNELKRAVKFSRRHFLCVVYARKPTKIQNQFLSKKLNNNQCYKIVNAIYSVFGQYYVIFCSFYFARAFFCALKLLRREQILKNSSYVILQTAGFYINNKDF